VYRHGRSKSNRFLVLYAFPRDDQAAGEGPRLGVSVSRKVGGAVDRTRVKRLLREAFWAEAERLPTGSDYVVVARPDARELAARDGIAGVRAALASLVEMLGGEGAERAGERAAAPAPGDQPAGAPGADDRATATRRAGGWAGSDGQDAAASRGGASAASPDRTSAGPSGDASAARTDGASVPSVHQDSVTQLDPGRAGPATAASPDTGSRAALERGSAGRTDASLASPKPGSPVPPEQQEAG
jgi:ribonuclease P protein component